MPLTESHDVQVSRVIPSSNIKFRITETVDPTIHKMVHSKETIDNLPKFIGLINKVAVPHLLQVYQDLKAGVLLESKKKQIALFFEKIASCQHYLDLKSLNKGFSKLNQCKKNPQANHLPNSKTIAAAKLFCTLNSKLTINKCTSFSNMKTLIEVNFSKTIKDKLYDQLKNKTSPTYTTESPIKSLKSSKISQKLNLDNRDDFSEENKEKMGKILENLNKKCQNIERIGENSFNKWKIFSVNKDKSNILISFALRNIVNKVMIRSFDKLNNYNKVSTQCVSKKIIELSNIINDIQKKLWFIKLKTFLTIKQQKGPYRFIKQLNTFMNTFKNAKNRQLLSGMSALKSINDIKQNQINNVLTRFFFICLNFQKNNTRSMFLQLRGNVITTKLEKINLTNRLKGRILIGCYKQCPSYSLKNAFLRFKVRTNRVLVKKAIDR